MMSIRTNQRGLGFIALLGLLALLAVLLFAAYIWLMLTWSYSRGERAGWVQKLSEKGYVCKTWEGEMAMVTMPGSIPEKFLFTVRDDAIAEKIKAVMGKRVAVDYEEHIGLITSCFGDTGHFVKDVKVIDETPAPLIIPGQSSGPLSSPQQQPTLKQ
jgi:hypothetical protein